MRTPSLAPQITKALSVALAIAATAILAFTALADYNAGRRPVAAPATPSATAGPLPEPTMPGSIDDPSTESPRPRIPAAQARRLLKRLTGTWAQNHPITDYFRFHSDGSGEWFAFGQRLWTGKATPRDATTFDLTDPSGQDSGYWRVKLTTGGRRLFFAGTRHTYRRT